MAVSRPTAPPMAYKESWLAYIIWLLFGTLGIHRIYFGHIFAAIIEFSLFALGTFLTSTVVGAIIGIPMLVIWFVMWVLDAFRIPGWVLMHNLRAREVNYR